MFTFVDSEMHETKLRLNTVPKATSCQLGFSSELDTKPRSPEDERLSRLESHIEDANPQSKSALWCMYMHLGVFILKSLHTLVMCVCLHV